MKIEKNPVKNASKNIVFFHCVFLWVLEGFGKGFGEVWGLLWESFGGSWGILDQFFWLENISILKNNFVFPFLRLLDSILGRFGRVWEGSGEDLGRFWEGFGEVLGFKKLAFWKIDSIFQNACFVPDHFSVWVFFSVPLSRKEFPTGNLLSQTPWGRPR